MLSSLHVRTPSTAKGGSTVVLCWLPMLWFTLGVAAADYGAQAGHILSEAEITGGLIVHLGCGDGRLTAALRTNACCVVHGLDADVSLIEEARRHIRSLGLYGPVSVEAWTARRLPYADGIVNLVLVSSEEPTARDEIMRVLAPNGVAVFLPALDLVRKPIPADIDEWTHFLHGPDNHALSRDMRVAPPNALQWDAPPKFGRSHEHDTTVPAMVTSGGRVFYIVDNGVTGITDKRLPQTWSVVARDAFNGIELWRKPMTDWGWPEWDPQRADESWADIAGVFVRAPLTLARRLVAVGDRVFCTLGYHAPASILDAATGECLRMCENSEGTDEIVFIDGRLLLLVERGEAQDLVCADAESGQTLWQWKPTVHYIESTLTAAQGRVFVCDRAKVVCLDLVSGDVEWEAGLPGGTPGRFARNYLVSLTVQDGVLLVLHRDGMHARDAATGALLWSRDGGQGYGMAFPPEAYVIDGSVLYFARPEPKLEPWPNAHMYDLRTGAPTNEVSVPPHLIGPRGHTRCYHTKATSRYLFFGFRAVEILDLEGGNHCQADWMKPACRYGVMPANGLLYVPSNPCQCHITRMIHGLNALVARSDVDHVEKPLLVKGPAYGDGDAAGPMESDPQEWPEFRHDERRTGATSISVPADLENQWEVSVGERPVQPVAAAGKLLVTDRESYILHCLNAATGRVVWRFVAGGRIDSPPTVRAGRLYFGSADGRVSCLRLADGALAWSFRAAPAERRIVSYGRLESAWPVHGSVLLLEREDGAPVVYFAAGRSSHLDGGIHLYGLAAASGEQLCHTVVRSPPKDGAERVGVTPGGTSDVLTTDGTYIFMRNNVFDRELRQLTEKEIAASDRPAGHHVSAWAGLLDDNTWNRAFWMYAKHWPTHYADQSPKAGQLLSVAGSTVFSLKYYTRRNMHSPMFFPASGGYLLVADRYDTEPYLYDGKPGSARPIKWLPTVHESQRFTYDLPVVPHDSRSTGYTRTEPPTWIQWIPIRVRAMVATREKLFVAGPPDVLKPGDPLAAFQGRAGAKLRVVGAAAGTTLREYDLPVPPVFDGMIAAYGRLYLATEDGRVLCMAGTEG